MKKISLILVVFVLYFPLAGISQNLKGDPWIFNAYQEMYRRQPTAWELNINNYNSGSWNSYAELKKYVQEFQTSLNNTGLTIVTQKAKNNNFIAGFVQGGKLLGVDLISAEGGRVVAAGGANVVAAGGANVVASGGLNLQISANTAGVSFGGRYSVQSTGTTIVPASGKSALIFR
jgi:hypothetical protein